MVGHLPQSVGPGRSLRRARSCGATALQAACERYVGAGLRVSHACDPCARPWMLTSSRLQVPSSRCCVTSVVAEMYSWIRHADHRCELRSATGPLWHTCVPQYSQGILEPHRRASSVAGLLACAWFCAFRGASRRCCYLLSQTGGWQTWRWGACGGGLVQWVVLHSRAHCTLASRFLACIILSNALSSRKTVNCFTIKRYQIFDQY